MKSVVSTCIFLLGAQLSAPVQGHFNTEQTLFVAGSTTLSEVVELFNPVYSKQTKQQLMVRPMGSQKGVVAVATEVAEVGLISRYLTAEEQRQWPNLRQIPIAQDAIVFFVHPQNQLNSISDEQVKSFYTGQQQDWPATAFTKTTSLMLLAKNQNHGTHDAFLQHFKLASNLSAQGAHITNRNSFSQLQFRDNENNGLFSGQSVDGFDVASQAVGTVSRFPNAIAFDSLGSVTILRKTAPNNLVKLLSFNNIPPLQHGKANRQYPLLRPLNLLVKEPVNAATQTLIDFALSSKGQQILYENGFIPLNIGKNQL